MEELILTDPVVQPEVVTNKYHVIAFTMDLESIAPPTGVPVPQEPGLVDIRLKDNNGKQFSHRYACATAVTMIKQLNTANLSIKSMHKRILEKLAADGVLPGTVAGAPDGV